MFAPNHEQTAGEIVRVTRPGGTIALASWTPDGFLGALFRMVAQFAPPPAGVASPMLWGSAEHVNSLFGPHVHWTHTTETFTFRFPTAEAFVDYFAEHYGPTLKAIAAANDRAEELKSALTELVTDLEPTRPARPGRDPSNLSGLRRRPNTKPDRDEQRRVMHLPTREPVEPLVSFSIDARPTVNGNR